MICWTVYRLAMMSPATCDKHVEKKVIIETFSLAGKPCAGSAGQVSKFQLFNFQLLIDARLFV